MNKHTFPVDPNGGPYVINPIGSTHIDIAIPREMLKDFSDKLSEFDGRAAWVKIAIDRILADALLSTSAENGPGTESDDRPRLDTPQLTVTFDLVDLPGFQQPMKVVKDDKGNRYFLTALVIQRLGDD